MCISPRRDKEGVVSSARVDEPPNLTSHIVLTCAPVAKDVGSDSEVTVSRRIKYNSPPLDDSSQGKTMMDAVSIHI